MQSLSGGEGWTRPSGSPSSPTPFAASWKPTLPRENRSCWSSNPAWRRWSFTGSFACFRRATSAIASASPLSSQTPNGLARRWRRPGSTIPGRATCVRRCTVPGASPSTPVSTGDPNSVRPRLNMPRRWFKGFWSRAGPRSTPTWPIWHRREPAGSRISTRLPLSIGSSRRCWAGARIC